MASPLQAAKCPSCGASLNSSGNVRGTKCRYCSSLLHSQELGEFCSCGRQYVAICSQCTCRLCNTHALTLRQFNLAAIIRKFAPQLAKRESPLIQSLYLKTNPTSLYCSNCIDTIIERWIFDSTNPQQRSSK